MKYDNNSIRQKVFSAVEKNYSLKIATFEFIPVGEDSYAYILQDSSDNKYFVKYSDASFVVTNIDTVNNLLQELRHFDFVVPPIQVDGKNSFPVSEGRVYVYPYLEGQVIHMGNDKFDRDLVSKLTNIIVKIHLATDSVSIDLPREDFTNLFKERLDILAKKLVNGDSEVKNLFKDNESVIREVIQQHTDLGQKYKKQKPDLVLTHGDVTGLNIIVNNDGIKLVDWDEAMFAPKERDLNFLYDNPYFSLEEYLQKAGKSNFDPDLKKYYGQKWALNSILGNFENLLETGSSDEDKKEYIEEIEEYLNYYR